jgi:crotonobetainyl-CoA:carnitine CoA-transferase CaiB-like acyl-CoA transferase
MVGGDPSYLPTVIADKTTAQNVVQAVLAALFHKERTGQGQEIEVPMFETMVSFVMTEHLMGQSFEPSLGEAGYPRLLAQHRRPYKTKDNKFIALLPYWDNHWRSFCELSGHAELITDPRFINMSERLKHINESYRLTGEIVAQKTRDEWLELLGQSNVPMMEVNTLDELIDDPQLIASGFWNVMDHPTEGQLRMTSPPINFSETPASIRRVPPLLGQHSEEILLEAGLSQSQIDDMLASGIAKSAD